MNSANERLTRYLESSFLAPLLAIETVTDISYNGERIFYEDAMEGRKPYGEEVT